MPLKCPMLIPDAPLFLLLALALSAALLHAQQARNPGSGDSPAAPVSIAVVATNAAGQPVTGLTQQDFSVIDNGSPAPILDFKSSASGPSSTTPGQVIFVVDEINMEFSDAANARSQLSRFLRQNGGHLAAPATILMLDDRNASLSGQPSLDGNSIANDLDHAAQSLRTIRRSAAFYGAVERLTLSLRALLSLTRYEAARPGRKLVIWISPGWPYLASPGTSYSQKQQQNNFATVVQVSTALRTAGITLYNIDPKGTNDALGFQTTFYRGYLKGVRKSSDTTLANLGLQVLAYQSGGLVLNSSNDIEHEIAQCFQDVNKSYLLTVPAAAGEPAVAYHTLGVRITQPGLVARTSAGYYVTP